ncbi:MAG: hypothetical protein AAFU85_04655 [Planctomycetota bacterium]
MWPILLIAIVFQTGFAYFLGFMLQRMERSGRLPRFPEFIEQTFPLVVNGYILFGLSQLAVSTFMGLAAAVSGVWCACVGAAFALGSRGAIWYSEHRAEN